jgi:hypothetical protein
MSLPEFSTQSFLFSTAALSSSLFPEDDRYRLFAKLVYPRLVKVRPQLTASYSAEDGRPAIEPLLLLGVSILQFLDGEPDRAAVEMLRYHAGWNFALNRQLNQPQLRGVHADDFLAATTQHIPDKGAQMVRYYGWYSNKMRGATPPRPAAATRDSPPGRLPAAPGQTPLQTLARLHPSCLARGPLALPGLPEPHACDCRH